MNSEEEGNDADDDYFQGDTVTEDMGKRNLMTFMKIASMLKRILN